MVECSKDLETQMNNLLNIFEQCVTINNEYRLKHNELTEIFRAYKILIENCDSEYISKNLYEILTELDLKFISKEYLNELLIDQHSMIKELNQINSNIKTIFPNIN